ncbi:MAG TPA: DUF721 domain-containing protein [Vicinamibacterales bacterium]|jgi:hypothetical protein|nr:DUF721 domain-containing protein [Vicinamibacterales bacterium]
MRQLNQAASGAIAELLRSSPMSDGKVDFAWKAAVGSAFCKVSAVKLVDKVLLVDVDTASWAREIRRATPIILRRLNALLGDETIASMTVRSKTSPRG